VKSKRYVPTVSLVTCGTCGLQKPRAEFPVVDGGKRIGHNCIHCSKAVGKLLASLVDPTLLIYGPITRTLLNAKNAVTEGEKK